MTLRAGILALIRMKNNIPLPEFKGNFQYLNKAEKWSVYLNSKIAADKLVQILGGSCGLSTCRLRASPWNPLWASGSRLAWSRVVWIVVRHVSCRVGYSPSTSSSCFFASFGYSFGKLTLVQLPWLLGHSVLLKTEGLFSQARGK